MKRYCCYLILLLLGLGVAGCSRHASAPMGDPIRTLALLDAQYQQWRGVPYRYGGTDKRGTDCSGFVYRTFLDRFARPLPRTTRAQSRIGQRVSPRALQPGDLLFFKTGRGPYGLHVGIYYTDQTFIHASTRRGVIRSSLRDAYWQRTFWQARRVW